MNPVYVIVVDMRQNNGKVAPIRSDTEGVWMKQFRTEAAARRLMKTHPLGKFPYEVVAL